MGTYGLQPADRIHWSAKAGNASIYTTTLDEARWISNLFDGKALNQSSQGTMLDTGLRIGYGCLIGDIGRWTQL